MQDTEAYNKIQKARTALILSHPFFATLSLRLKVKEDYSCHTAWTDGSVFAYNPHYVNMLSSEKLEGMAAHIVMHPACNHHKRRNGRNPKTWNRACDYVINGILLDAGFTQEQDSQEQENQLPAETGTESFSDLEEKEDSNTNSDPGMTGEIRDADTNDGSGDGETSETDWDEAVIQAAISARGIGKLPAGIERLLDRQLSPQLDWQELLARFIEQNAKTDYTWTTPNRRYLHKNLYLPSLRNCELENVVIGVDSSGSISESDLSKFSAEITSIFSQYPANIHILYCDNRIQKVDILTRSDLPVTITPKGGGGTDFRPVFDYVEENNLDPSCLIYLTDLECISYPQKHPHYPTLWVKTGTGQNFAPFGEMIHLK